MRTLQTLMLSILVDRVEESMEVLMDDFYVVDYSFEECLEHLSRVLQRCVETNLVLDWDKFTFIVNKKRIVLRN